MPRAADSDGLIIAINLPTCDMVHSDFAVDLARLISYTEHHCAGQLKALLVNSVRGSIVHKSRQLLAEQAEAQGADYSLWVDSDMRFPRDALVRLLNAEQDIVAANYVTRAQPMRYVAVKKIATEEDGGARLETRPESTGLEEAEVVGFGLVLIHGSVWEQLGPAPWFQFSYDPDLGIHIGEDAHFCRLATAAGLKVMVDHDLSKEVRHMGQWDFRLDHLWMMEEAEAEARAAVDEAMKPKIELVQ